LLLALTDTPETQVLIRRKLARQSASLPSLNQNLLFSVSNRNNSKPLPEELRVTFESHEQKNMILEEENDTES